MDHGRTLGPDVTEGMVSRRICVECAGSRTTKERPSASEDVRCTMIHVAEHASTEFRFLWW